MFQKFVKLVGGNDHKEESKVRASQHSLRGAGHENMSEEQPSQSSSQQAPAAMPKTAEEAKDRLLPHCPP
eukprot:2533656-Amphidinium_carterae.1